MTRGTSAHSHKLLLISHPTEGRRLSETAALLHVRKTTLAVCQKNYFSWHQKSLCMDDGTTGFHKIDGRVFHAQSHAAEKSYVAATVMCARNDGKCRTTLSN